MRKNKGPTLLQGAGLYIAKLNKDPILNKNVECKCPSYYYKALGQLHKFHKENKINARREIIFEGARALDPLKKLN